MGIIKAITNAVGGSLADQWLEVIEPGDMGDQTVFVSGQKVRRGTNTRGTDHTVSNGSVIHVYPNQFMMLVDGGRIVDYTAEEGYYTVKNSALPSLFNGEFGDALGEAFDRVRFGGVTPTSQKVFYVNLQEIKGIKFGTRNPLNYFDQFYNAELFLRAHGTYSVKVTNPLLFYAEVIPKNMSRVQVDDINAQYLDEFLEAFQTSINQMSADGIRISFVASKGRELGKYMADTLDDDWNRMRGIEIQSVGIASITYDEESQKLINMRNQGAMLSDPAVREGYVQGAAARGIEAAGSNAGGSMAGFMGMGVGMNAAGGFLGNASAANLQQMQMNQAAQMNQAGQTARAAQVNQAAQAAQTAQAAQVNQAAQTAQTAQMNQAAQAAPADSGVTNVHQGVGGTGGTAAPAMGRPGGWTCPCGTVNTGKFCSECGSPKPAPASWTCQCGTVNTGKFCSECGTPRA